MYLPIPEGVNHTHTVTASLPGSACDIAYSQTKSVTFTKPASTIPLTKKSNSALEVIDRPNDGVWSEIKASGSIKMTPMEIKKESTTYEIGRLQVPYIKWGSVAAVTQFRSWDGSKCKSCIDRNLFDAKAPVAKGRYVEQGDLDYWKSKYPSAPHYVVPIDKLDDNQIEAAKSSVYAELFQAYNLGEEIAELRESLSSITSLVKRGVGLTQKFRKKITDRPAGSKDLKDAADRWMEYRYGIMPIIYSIQDILTLKEDTGLYRTARKVVHPKVEVPDLIQDKPDVYFEDTCIQTIKATITAKARWKSERLKMYDLINVNPITTFTAVLPWSMVVRWFFNVQSVLDARIKSLTSLALESHACVAIREKREYRTYLSARIGYVNSAMYWLGDNPRCGSNFHPTQRWIYTDFERQDILLATSLVNNYKRYLFTPSDVKVVYSPHLTWQRGIDALILGMRPLSKLLRSLK